MHTFTITQLIVLELRLQQTHTPPLCSCYHRSTHIPATYFYRHTTGISAITHTVFTHYHNYRLYTTMHTHSVLLHLPLHIPLFPVHYYFSGLGFVLLPHLGLR